MIDQGACGTLTARCVVTLHAREVRSPNLPSPGARPGKGRKGTGPGMAKGPGRLCVSPAPSGCCYLPGVPFPPLAGAAFAVDRRAAFAVAAFAAFVASVTRRST